MSEAPQEQPSVVASTRRTWSWVWRVLGILLGTATVISLVKNGFAIELHGIPAAIFRQYTWLRDMLFEPVVWVLRYFGLTMPWWLKDIVMAYALGAGAMWRASESGSVTVDGDRVRFEGRKGVVHRIMGTIVWPRVAYYLPRKIREDEQLVNLLKLNLDDRSLERIRVLRFVFPSLDQPSLDQRSYAS